MCLCVCVISLHTLKLINYIYHLRLQLISNIKSECSRPSEIACKLNSHIIEWSLFRDSLIWAIEEDIFLVYVISVNACEGQVMRMRREKIKLLPCCCLCCCCWYFAVCVFIISFGSMYLGAPWWPLLGRDSALRHHILYERKIYALHIGIKME